MLIVRKRRYRLAHRFSTGFLALLMLMTQTVPPGGTLWATPPSGDPPPEFSVAEAAVVRRGVTLNGYGRIEGSLHQLQADTSVLNGNASVTGQYYAAVTPNVQVNGNPALGGVVQGTGSTQPSGYKITINGSVSLPHLVVSTGHGSAVWQVILRLEKAAKQDIGLRRRLEAYCKKCEV